LSSETRGSGAGHQPHQTPSGRPLRAPIFEIGLKGYAYGAEAVRLALAADRLVEALDVTIIFDPQAVDIAAVARETRHVHVFAQHMDPFTPGRGAGAVLAEAIREAGAVGTMLNHSERRMTLTDIAGAIRRAREVGLATLVCADSPEEAAAVATLGPDIVLAEPPELIATSRSAANEMQWFVERAAEMVRAVDPAILVMCGAGVQTPDDVARMIALGVDGTGSSSAILRASDPVAQMEVMLAALRHAWDVRPGSDPGIVAPAGSDRTPSPTASTAGG
jgi:triosephosphate isomerase (TIM)